MILQLNLRREQNQCCSLKMLLIINIELVCEKYKREDTNIYLRQKFIGDLNL